jgi:hypothetical protein
MREGYRREATNNIIINNSLHPNVWYPNSDDIFKCNIVFGAYKPAAMERILAPNGKWGTQLDSNLFLTNQRDRLMFVKNGCDANSAVGDPLSKDKVVGDFRVKKESPALQIGFKNFPMDQFGVSSEKLKKIAKQSVIPSLIVAPADNSNLVFKWYGATVKNVGTPGEQLAAGLAEISRVILLNIPANSILAKANLRNGDVILECEGVKVLDLKQLLRIAEVNQSKDILKLVIQ